MMRRDRHGNRSPRPGAWVLATRRACALGLAVAASATAVSAQRPAAAKAPASLARTDTARLRRTLDSIADRHHGVVGYAIRNLETGERLARRGDETFPTASLIKVPVMVTVYDLVAKGELSLDDPLTLLKIDKVGGAGVLHLLKPGLVLSVAPDSTKKYGLGVTTPNEMATLFALIADGKAVSPAADSAMLAMLDDNQDAELLQRHVTGIRAPHKTGAVDAARTECAIFYLQSRVVACALTKENQDQRWLVDNEAQVTLGAIGRAVVAAWPPAPKPATAP
ncbi:MAG: serine hydrolase [Gemmatimonadetes bacterium]|nr:serine hydrolase [Gemmatimonadota bacterium]